MAETIDPQLIIDEYGRNAQVLTANGVAMNLGQALDFEALLCTASEADKQDPAKRVGHLTYILGMAGSLRPEHEHLVIEPKSD